MHIKEFARLTGVSPRTLRYYEELGLLKPLQVDQKTGYRLYGDENLERMREILFYRELDFSLKTIGDILSSPDYDKKEAMARQKKLLKLKKERLERLIAAIESAEKGENTVDTEIFKKDEYLKYRDEVKARWGDTDAYKESEKKTAEYGEDKMNGLQRETEGIFKEFADLMAKGESFESKAAQSLVRKWQSFITENFYRCTDEILLSLGQMYTADERFLKNIDRCQEGTALFVQKAIEHTVKK